MFKHRFNLFNLFLHEEDGGDGGTAPKPAETQETQEPSSKDSLLDLPKDELVKIVKSTREEAASRRVENKDLNAKLAKIEEEQKKASEDELLKKGEFEKLANDRAEELALLKVELENTKTSLKEWEDEKTARREEYKEKLGDVYDESMDMLPLNSLKNLVDKLGSKKTFETDNGTPRGNQTDQKKFQDLLAKGKSRTFAETREMNELALKIERKNKEKKE